MGGGIDAVACTRRLCAAASDSGAVRYSTTPGRASSWRRGSRRRMAALIGGGWKCAARALCARLGRRADAVLVRNGRRLEQIEIDPGHTLDALDCAPGLCLATDDAGRVIAARVGAG
jgi:hypothetical protein